MSFLATIKRSLGFAPAADAEDPPAGANCRILSDGMAWPAGSIVPRHYLQPGDGAAHVQLGAVEFTDDPPTHTGPIATTPGADPAPPPPAPLAAGEFALTEGRLPERHWLQLVRQTMDGRPILNLGLVGGHDPGRGQRVDRLGLGAVARD